MDTSESIESIALFKSGGDTSSAPAERVETPTGETAASPAASGRDDAGRFKATEKAEGEQPAAKSDAGTKAEGEAPADVKGETKVDEKPTGQLAALIAERSKRQQLERELAALKAAPGAQAEKPDIFTDPDKAVSAMVEERVAPIKRRFFTSSLEAAQGRHTDDFEQAAQGFMQLLDANPALETQWRNAEDPGEFLYVVGTSTPEFRKATDERHRSVVTAKDAEIAALKAQLESATVASRSQSEVPESLNRQPSGAVPSRGSNPDDINQIVRFKSG